MSSGLFHVNLNVGDMDRSVGFYTNGLGFVVVCETIDETEIDGRPTTIRQAVLTIPDSRTILALTHATAFTVGPGGLNHLGLILDSNHELEDLLERVQRNGGRIQKRGEREVAGIVEAFAYVRDPDDYAIELATQAILYAQFPD